MPYAWAMIESWNGSNAIGFGALRRRIAELLHEVDVLRRHGFGVVPLSGVAYLGQGAHDGLRNLVANYDIASFNLLEVPQKIAFELHATTL